MKIHARFSLLTAAFIFLLVAQPLIAQRDNAGSYSASVSTNTQTVSAPRLSKTTAASTLQFTADKAAEAMEQATQYAQKNLTVEANSFFETALRLYTSLAANDPEHYTTALAGAYEKQAAFWQGHEHWAEAEAAYNNAALVYERRLMDGQTDLMPALTKTITALGVLYQMQDKTTEAAEAYAQALEAYTYLSGQSTRGGTTAKGASNATAVERMYTAEFCNTSQTLGLLYQTQGRASEAETLLQQALQGYTVLSQTDASLEPQTAVAAANLAHFYQSTNNTQQAERYYLQAAGAYERLARNANSRFTSAYRSALNNVATFYGRIGNTAASNLYLDKANSLTISNGPEKGIKR